MAHGGHIVTHSDRKPELRVLLVVKGIGYCVMKACLFFYPLRFYCKKETAILLDELAYY